MKLVLKSSLRFLLIGLIFSNRFISSALADCRPGQFHLPLLSDAPLSQISAVLHDKTGCNFVFQKDLLNKKLTLPEGNYQPVSLMSQMAKDLHAQLSVARTVLVVSATKLPLKGTGKLVSLQLADAPIASVNQILKKLGSEKLVSQKAGGKITSSLYDVPLDDLAALLELQSDL